ncbi:MAG TPA: hypothetical protein VFX16_37770 [Pseudonocardiaceae bacterium]|nr:hypothetical protein [Pseudonocardiaceae bacterium]
MRLLPDLPRSARLLKAAVSLLCLAAALEIATWCAVLVTRDSVVVRLGVPARLPLDLVAAPLALLVLAVAIGHRRRWGAGGLVALTLLTTIGLLSAVTRGATTYAPVDVITDALAWATTLTAAILVAIRSARPAATQEFFAAIRSSS